MTVAALYIDPRGPYPRIAEGSEYSWDESEERHGWLRADGATGNVDCWDEARDARSYAGPHPVVAHPPCRHWGRLQHLAHVQCVQAECAWHGSTARKTCPECGYPLTSDRDCALRAIEQVRQWGGVLEHPAGSLLWEECGLPTPGQCDGCDLLHARGNCCDSFGGYSVEVDQVEWGHVARKRTWLYLVGVPRSALEAPPFPGREPTHWVCSAAQRRRTPPLFAEYLVRLARAAEVTRG